jgi:pimeloyl-ACP methyl ester carboxylesterase
MRPLQRFTRSTMTLLLISAADVMAQRPTATARTYVIVHGAWGGGWDWRAIDSMLSLEGHRVVRVTLTGLGERVHLASPAIGLDTHIADVVNTIEWEQLRDVILIGHSYGGMVITGAADRIPDRLRRLVYLDAFLPESGESASSWADAIGSSWVRDNVRNGMVTPVWVSDTIAVPRDVPQPYRTLTDTLQLVNPAGQRVPGTYILTFEPTALPDRFQRFADRAAARGWSVQRLEADHTPERSAREPLVALLLALP